MPLLPRRFRPHKIGSQQGRSWRTRRELGAVMVEGTIAIPLYLILTLTVVDLSRVIFQRITLQYVANQILRDAVTICDVDGSAGAACPLIDNTGGHEGCRSRRTVPGGYLTPDDLACYGTARAEILRDHARKMAAGLALQVDPAGIFVCRGSAASCATNDAGLPEDLVTVSIQTSLRPLALMWLPIQIPINIRVVG